MYITDPVGSDRKLRYFSKVCSLFLLCIFLHCVSGEKIVHDRTVNADGVSFILMHFTCVRGSFGPRHRCKSEVFHINF